MWQDIEKLKKAGYKVVERNDFRYQIITERAVINVWPSKKKYMREYGSGASYYTDIVETMESVVGKPGQKRDIKAAIARKQAYWARVLPVVAWDRRELDLLIGEIQRRVDKRVDTCDNVR